MSLKLITPPAVLAISLADMKVDLRETGTDKDAQITRLIRGATERAEHQTGRALLEQEWELIIDAFPAGEIELANPPVMSITSVKYMDVAGAEQTLLSTQYTLDADLLPGYLFPAYGTSWPPPWTWPTPCACASSAVMASRRRRCLLASWIGLLAKW